MSRSASAEAAAPRAPGAAAVEWIASALAGRYGPWPEEGLPVLDQLVWFLISTRTTVENCEAAYAALRSAFPLWGQVAQAPEASLYAPLRPSGLYRTRARNLLALLAAVEERFGEASLEGLRALPDEDCEAFLRSLPGVGLKVARCAMSFGLGRRRFAVDAHIWRITRRLGWHAFAGEAPSERGADALQEIALLAADPLSLHVNLIRLGREFCPAGEALCDTCPLARRCPSAAPRPRAPGPEARP